MKKLINTILLTLVLTLVACSKTTTTKNMTSNNRTSSKETSSSNTSRSTSSSRTTSRTTTTTRPSTTTTKSSTTTTKNNEYTFPDLYLNTDYGRKIISKEDYIHCLVTVSNSPYNIIDEEAGVRGRGNSSWAWDKKPYRIKFDSKVNLFNNGKAKSWTLIANHCDLSLSRNYLAFELSRNTDDIEYTSSTQFVNFYLNGEYRGLYLVCDQMQSGKTRVNINEDLTGVPEETGYLLEMDVADRVTFEGGKENEDFFTLGSDTSKAYVLKTPDTDDENYNVSYLNYIKGYMNQVYSLLSSTANHDNYVALSNYVDLNTFADTYIISELFNNCDVGWSMYMYKDVNGKLKSGPLWDFDISSGNCAYHPNSCNPEYMWARSGSMWYSNLFRFSDFRDLVEDKMEIYKDRFIGIINDTVDNLLLYEEEFNRNFTKWDILTKGINMGDTPISTETLLSFTTWKEHILYLQEWLLDSLDAMAVEYSK